MKKSIYSFNSVPVYVGTDPVPLYAYTTPKHRFYLVNRFGYSERISESYYSALLAGTFDMRVKL